MAAARERLRKLLEVHPVKAARELLGWEAKLDMETMAAGAWRWQQKNPDGYTP